MHLLPADIIEKKGHGAPKTYNNTEHRHTRTTTHNTIQQHTTTTKYNDDDKYGAPKTYNNI